MGPVQECIPLTVDGLLRFYRECQIAAGTFIPPTDAARVLPAVWTALGAVPDVVEENALRPLGHTLLELAKHTLDQRWRQSGRPGGASGRRGCGDYALNVLLQTDVFSALSLTDVAACIGVSRWHLCRSIRHATGFGFATHLNGVRVLKAILLLANPTLEVKAIATACGYHHTSELDRDFKKWLHMPPTYLRRAYCR